MTCTPNYEKLNAFFSVALIYAQQHLRVASQKRIIYYMFEKFKKYKNKNNCVFNLI